jgi:hypothetical protein
MDTQTTQPDISNISTETVAPKKRYIKKPKLEITKETTEDEIIARELDTQPVKPKRGQSEKTKLALAEGRKKLQELNFQKRVERTQFITEQMNKKANRIAEQKLKILQDLNLDDDDDENESILADVIPKTPKASKSIKSVKEVKEVKAKKPPKVVYISEDEEDEEEEQEIIYKVKPRSNNREKKQMQQVQQSQPQQINKPVYPSIVFY